jgi:enoyl-CoA hydratase
MAVRGAEMETRGRVGWIILNDYQESAEASLNDPDYVHTVAGVSDALQTFRDDPAIHVIVITGRNDGEFYRVCRGDHYDDPGNRGRLNPIRNPRSAGFVWPSHTMQLLATVEKPVVARVNGDAIGLGAAFLWGCDIIVAFEDSVISDVHLGQRDVVDTAGEIRGFPWAVTPGDGAVSFAPLYMPPTKVKEFFLLSRVWTFKQLADMNIVNYAVKRDQIDVVVDEIVDALLARPATVLARAKRVLNKRMIEHWNLVQDLAIAYEQLDFWEHAGAGRMD